MKPSDDGGGNSPPMWPARRSSAISSTERCPTLDRTSSVSWSNKGAWAFGTGRFPSRVTGEPTWRIGPVIGWSTTSSNEESGCLSGADQGSKHTCALPPANLTALTNSSEVLPADPSIKASISSSLDFKSNWLTVKLQLATV